MADKKVTRSAKEDVVNDVEVGILLRHCRDLLDQIVIRIPLYTGMRIGEVQHMRNTWVNFDKGYIQIPSRQACGCFECRRFRGRIWEPKSKAGIRNLLIVPEVGDILRQAFQTKPYIAKSRQLLEIRFAKIKGRAGITEKRYPHCLRATFATRMAEQGMSAPSLTYIMGWESLEPAEAYVQSSMKRAHLEQKEILGLNNPDLHIDTNAKL